MGDVVIFYGHAASNWGDLAINSGVVQLVECAGHPASEIRAVRMRPSDRYDRLSRESLDGAQTTDMYFPSAGGDLTRELMQLSEYFESPDDFVRKYRLRAADLIVLNAGEHLFESSTGENLRDLLWRILPLISANRAATPLVVMPSTLGPFRSNLGHQLTRVLARLPVAFAFRESSSKDLMRSTDLSTKPVLLDPGFFAKGLNPRASSPTTLTTIGLVFRLEDYGLRAGSKRSAYMQAKSRSNEFRDSTGLRVFDSIAEHHLNEGRAIRLLVQTQADREITVALYNALRERHPDGNIQLRDPETFQEYLDELRSLDLLITSRFHAVILAEAQRVPCVGIYSESHGHKMPGLFNLLGYPGGAVRMDERYAQRVSEDVMMATDVSWGDRGPRWERIQELKDLTRSWFHEALGAARTGPVDTSRLQIAALAGLNRVLSENARRQDLTAIKSSLFKIQDALRGLGDHESSVHPSDVLSQGD